MLLKIMKKIFKLTIINTRFRSNVVLINTILELFQRGKKQWTQVILVIHGKTYPSIKIISLKILAK